MAKLLQPQEIEVFYIIPSLKRELAKCMNARGIRQNKIANLLQIEKSAVSQYLSGKRGAEVNFPEEFTDEIYKSARLITDKISFIREIQRLVNIARENNTVCEVHKKYSDVPEDCSPDKVNCFNGCCSVEEESEGCGAGCGCHESDEKACSCGGEGNGKCCSENSDR